MTTETKVAVRTAIQSKAGVEYSIRDSYDTVVSQLGDSFPEFTTWNGRPVRINMDTIESIVNVEVEPDVTAE